MTTEATARPGHGRRRVPGAGSVFPVDELARLAEARAEVAP